VNVKRLGASDAMDTGLLSAKDDAFQVPLDDEAVSQVLLDDELMFKGLPHLHTNDKTIPPFCFLEPTLFIRWKSNTFRNFGH